ncbi:MAG: hypothetical protein B6I20_07830 [Bacteroidetes bacterium 4572_117]|nr:MAG: hypothetical protein B6I20_07830 [Bacteroidetes bacterium 4572_117]
MQTIEKCFINLISKHTDNDAIMQMFWLELKEKYSSKSRHYHNLSHIAELLHFFFEFEHLLVKKDIVLFAIFYHDIVYDVKKKNNEEKSAELAKLRMKELNIQANDANLCYNYIVATKSHETMFADPDLAYFLDFDLAILGKDWIGYSEYTEKVRKEYSIYPNVLYKKGRKKALNNILENDRIYKTEDFFRKFEKQARKNIKKEIDELSNYSGRWFR